MRLSSSFALVVILIISFVSLSQAVAVVQPPMKPSHGLNASEVKCTYVNRHTKSCLDWTKGKNGLKNSEKPPKTCCYEMFKLDTMGLDGKAEVAICECMKKELQDPNVNAKAAESLTTGCGVLLSFPTTKNVDCSKITAPNTKH
ncbi:unnamed protein product [Withania somnifera]